MSLSSKLVAFLTGLQFLFVSNSTSQTFTTLHSFAGPPGDGAHPYAGLILSNNKLYGTTLNDGSFGAIFSIDTDGSGFTNIYRFYGESYGPYSRLTLLGNSLYGTISSLPSPEGGGMVYALNTDGTGFTNIHVFTSEVSDGWWPYAGLIFSNGILYGTTGWGGSFWEGTVFSLDVNGTAFTNLHSFAGVSNGANPWAELVLSGNTLYGTTPGGGVTNGYGTAFKINTDGTGFSNLHSFTATSEAVAYDLAIGTNNDGANPYGGLVLLGDTLYGAAAASGAGGSGTIFKVNTNGTGFTAAYAFNARAQSNPQTNSDGANPYATPILSGNVLYGTTSAGGNSANGTVFRVSTDGTGFRTLHHFTNADGASPYGALVISGSTLYGTTMRGGAFGYGTVFSFSLPPPQLTIAAAGTNVILSWPASPSGFSLQTTTNLASAVWSTVSTAPVVLNGQITVSSPISGSQAFYRLSQ